VEKTESVAKSIPCMALYDATVSGQVVPPCRWYLL